MSKKPYRGQAGKAVWENMNFSKGMVYNNESRREGEAKTIANLDISQTGGSLKPRKPYFNTSFKFAQNDLPITLHNDTMLFKSRQDSSYQFYINIGGERKDKAYHQLNIDSIEYKDGDSFVIGDKEYRLLAIDAAEYYDEEGEPTAEGIAALNALQNMIDTADPEAEFYAVYDKANDTDIDAFDRHLIWLYIKEGEELTNVNLTLLNQESSTLFRVFGLFDEEKEHYYVPEYLGHSEFPFEDDYENLITPHLNSVDFTYSIVKNNINIYRRPVNTVLIPFQQDADHILTPSLALDVVPGILNVSQLYEDLEVEYGNHLEITLNNIDYEAPKETHTYTSQYKPWTQVDDIDGIAFLGTIKVEGEEVYKGIMSLRYDVPLSDNKPQFDKASFKLETYKNNAFKVRFEDLNVRYSLNLLDPQIPGRRDYIGEEAAEFNYFTYLIPTIGVLDSNDRFISQLAAGKEYMIRPYYVLPELDEQLGHAGYAVKWEFYRDARHFQNKVVRYFDMVDEFPERGNSNTIYVDAPNNEYYEWDGSEYNLMSIPPMVQDTGWGLTFDRKGNSLENRYTFESFKIVEDELIPIKRFSQYELNNQNGFDFTKVNELYFRNEGGSNVYYSRYHSDFIGLIGSEIGESPTTPCDVRFDFSNYTLITDEKTYIYQTDQTINLKPEVVIYAADKTTEIERYGLDIENFKETLTIPSQPGSLYFARIENIMIPEWSPTGGIWGYYHNYKTQESILSNVETNVDEYLHWVETTLEFYPKMSTNHPIIQEILDDARGSFYIRVKLVPVSMDENGHIEETDLQLNQMARINAMTINIRSDEEVEVQYEHGQNLQECRGITFYHGHVVLYDSPKARNVIYISDVAGNLSYFPFRRALDQFASDIVHIQPVKQGLMVFTVTDIYLVFEVEDPNGEIIFMSQVVYTNLTINNYQRNTVHSVGRDVLFMADNSILMLRPNPYVNDIADMFLQDLSRPIQGILENPNPLIIKILMYYGVLGEIFTSEWIPKYDYYSIVRNKEVLFFISVEVPSEDPLTVILVYDRERHIWKTYYTRVFAFPYNNKTFDSDEGIHMLARNSQTVDNGTSLVINEKLNLWEFDEGYGRYFDIKSMKIESGSFVYNTAKINEEDYDEEEYHKVKQPLYIYLDTGFLNTSPQLNKRFHKTYLEMRNTDVVEMPLNIEFNIDGRARQTSNTLRMINVENGESQQVIGEYSYEFDGYNFEGYDFSPFKTASNAFVEGGTAFQTWQLGMQRFGPLNKLRVEFGLSGRGRNPNLEFMLKTTGKFEIFGYGIVYKEQSNF